jgi:hypothetical protein
MPAPSDANPTFTYTALVPGYDPVGHQYGIIPHVTNVTTDTNVTPNMVYGDLVANVTFPTSFLSGSDYPAGASPITATSGNVANAVATATLAAASGKTTYITGFELTGSGALVGLPVIVTVTNLISGTMSYIYCALAGVLVGNVPLIVQFSDAIPANAANTSIVVSCPALGLGNTNNVVNAHGYQL